MRFFYILLLVSLKYALRFFYPRLKTVNSPKTFLGRTIYVSNHAASFMDPLVIGGLRMPIVFFLTRSDVFNPITRPFLWAAHMLPIYRQHDGVDTKDQNKKTFQECTQILKYGRNLLIFGEGFTDDVFIRRLKPVKKGAVRIGFSALESMNWKKKIYIAAVGCNYSDPNRMRSDVLIATSHRICLNDFREQYEENPNLAISELTKMVEQLMKDQITHVEKIEWCDFHEHVMRLTRKGMNALNSDTRIPLIRRWHYSRKLAQWLNERTNDELSKLKGLKHEMTDYFSQQKQLGINENYIFDIVKHKRISRTKEFIYLLFLFPFALLGLTHCGLPYVIVKKFVERSFKRSVFWGSVKLLLGMISMGLVNIPVIFLFHTYIYPSYWLGTLYYLLIGLFGLAAYMWWINLIRYREKGQVKKMDVDAFVAKRTKLLDDIHALIPVA